MSFVLASKDSIKQVVKILIPADFGKTKKADIEVEFTKMSVSDAQAMYEELDGDRTTEDKILLDNIKNIDGVKDEDGSDIPYSSELLDQLLDMEYVRKPLIDSFNAVQLGRKVINAKN